MTAGRPKAKPGTKRVTRTISMAPETWLRIKGLALSEGLNPGRALDLLVRRLEWMEKWQEQRQP